MVLALEAEPMITRETTFVASGCKRCGGALRGDVDEVRCFNCGYEPMPDVPPEILVAQARQRAVARYINGVYVAG